MTTVPLASHDPRCRQISGRGLYCEFMAQESWEQRLTSSVATQVRRYRRLRKMSAQGLSDRCAELGVPIARPVLSNLENGRRESITLAELLVLAQVLEVPPTLLISPVDIEPTMEILPARVAQTEDVLEWFAGERRFVITETGPGLEAEDSFWIDAPGAAGYVHLYQHHSRLAAILSTERDISDSWGQAAVVEESLDAGVRRMMRGAGELRLVRRTMREKGLRVPELPPELQFLEAEEPPIDAVRDRIRHAVRRS